MGRPMAPGAGRRKALLLACSVLLVLLVRRGGCVAPRGAAVPGKLFADDDPDIVTDPDLIAQSECLRHLTLRATMQSLDV